MARRYGVRRAILFLLIGALALAVEAVRPCALASSGACVCNTTYCDDVAPVNLNSSQFSYVLYQSSMSGDRLRRIEGDFSPYNQQQKFTIQLDPTTVSLILPSCSSSRVPN